MALNQQSHKSFRLARLNMKRSVILILLPVLILVTAVSAQDLSRKIIQINLAGKTDQAIKQLLKSGIDVTAIDWRTNTVNALVSGSEIQHIKNLGFTPDIILPDADAFARQVRESGYFDHFHNYDQMLQEMQEIVANHSDIALLEDIGDSYEKTVGRGGYDIWALKISDNVQVEEAEPEVFYMANMHAREIITPEIIMYFMHYLIDNYGTDASVTYLVNNRQIWLCPTFNPDGHEYVFSGSSPNSRSDPMWWRKNKRDNNDNGIFDPESDGVDLNRNFGYKWGLDNIGSSSDPTSNVYRGTGPFSEPESQAIRDFVLKHHFIITLSFHSYSQLWLYPWGYTGSPTPDEPVFMALADSCVAYNGYHPETGYGLYSVNGDTDDWFYGEQTTKNKIFAFTPEVGNRAESLGGYTGFFPDTAFIRKQILENQGPMLYLAFAAGEEPIIEHTPLKDTESSGPYPIIATIKQPIVLTSPVSLDESSYKLFYRGAGSAAYDSVSLLPTGNPNEYTADIPDLSPTDSVYYYLAAADQQGRKATLPKGAPLATFSFKIGSDLVAPTIEHAPLDYASVYATGISITAFVTDNIAVATIRLFYRKNGGDLDSLDMSPLVTPDLFQGTIVPQNAQVGDIYEYKIKAVDNSRHANMTWMPESGYYQFSLKNSLIYDFELDASFAETTSNGDWEWGVPKSGPNSAHSGSMVWATNLGGNYSDLTESILETPEISLAEQDSATLIFWHWYQNEYSQNTFWDGGNIKISVDNDSFRVIEPEGGYDGTIDNFNNFLGLEPCFGGPASNGNFWHQETVDLTPYLNHSIKIRFHFASDQAVNDLGWYIDDVEIAFGTMTSVSETNPALNLPATFELHQNYPNPFNPETRIGYRLAQAGEVTVEIFDLLGKKVATLVQQQQNAGSYTVVWQGKDDLGHNVSSGVYFYRLQVRGKNFSHSFTQKMVKLQ